MPEAYAAFMRTGWGDRELDLPAHPITAWAQARRQRLTEQFPGERLVIPAGGFKVRANDTDYRFRAETAHTYLCGNQTSDAVLVIEGGEAVLYARPRSSRETDEFFRDRQYGELWAGRRPSLKEISDSLGLETRHLDELPAHARPASAKTRVLRGVDAAGGRAWSPVTAAATTTSPGCSPRLRLVKDEWELGELQSACDITTLGFEDSVREWDRVLEYGERWVEGTFFRRARAMGNDIGYDSIVGGGRHATTLHWIENSGPITPGELVLLDMGAEATSLYTADVTRTLPVDGTFTAAAARPLLARARRRSRPASTPYAPGRRSAHRTRPRWRCSRTGSTTSACCRSRAEEALSPDSRVYARWTLHGTSHMLGMDVHDCAAADTGIYPGGELEEGMVLTVEPGLYFQEDDLLVPEELRGIGIRIEDDVVVTADGVRNLSEALPRDPDEIEAWMAITPRLSPVSRLG